MCVAASPGTVALWSAQAKLDAPSISTGTFELTAHWVDGPPNLNALFPGQSAEATFTASVASTGTTLAWNLLANNSVAADFEDYVDATVWAGSCGTGTVIGEAGYLASGVALEPGQIVRACVRYTLDTNAPSGLQGQAINPVLTITGKQAGG